MGQATQATGFREIPAHSSTRVHSLSSRCRLAVVSGEQVDSKTAARAKESPRTDCSRMCGSGGVGEAWPDCPRAPKAAPLGPGSFRAAGRHLSHPRNGPGWVIFAFFNFHRTTEGLFCVSRHGAMARCQDVSMKGPTCITSVFSSRVPAVQRGCCRPSTCRNAPQDFHPNTNFT